MTTTTTNTTAAVAVATSSKSEMMTATPMVVHKGPPGGLPVGPPGGPPGVSQTVSPGSLPGCSTGVPPVGVQGGPQDGPVRSQLMPMNLNNQPCPNSELYTVPAAFSSRNYYVSIHDIEAPNKKSCFPNFFPQNFLS